MPPPANRGAATSLDDDLQPRDGRRAARRGDKVCTGYQPSASAKVAFMYAHIEMLAQQALGWWT